MRPVAFVAVLVLSAAPAMRDLALRLWNEAVAETGIGERHGR